MYTTSDLYLMTLTTILCWMHDSLECSHCIVHAHKRGDTDVNSLESLKGKICRACKMSFVNGTIGEKSSNYLHVRACHKTHLQDFSFVPAVRLWATFNTGLSAPQLTPPPNLARHPNVATPCNSDPPILNSITAQPIPYAYRQRGSSGWVDVKFVDTRDTSG